MRAEAGDDAVGGKLRVLRVGERAVLDEGVPSSSSSRSRSRAKSLPCSAFFWWYFSAPPLRTRAESPARCALPASPASRRWPFSLRHSPVNTGLRFSAKARSASTRSLVAEAGLVHPVLEARGPPRCRGAGRRRWRAWPAGWTPARCGRSGPPASSATSRRVPAGATRETSPIARASAAPMRLPVRIRSLARATPDQARAAADRSPAARDDPEADLGEPHLGALGGDPQVAGERQLEPAAQRRAVERGHEGLRRRLDAPEGARSESWKCVDVVGRHRRPLLEVGARAEGLVPRAR